MICPAQHRNAWLLAAIVFGVAAFTARADGPIILGQQEHRPVLTLDPFTGAFGLAGIYQSATAHAGGTTSNSSELQLQQELTLNTGGGVVSKNFLEWKGSITAGLTEDWSQTDSAKSSSLGVIEQYDLTAKVLQNSIMPVDFWARRSEGYTTRTFASLLKETTSTYGAAIAYHSPSMPTSLRIYRTDTTQSSLSGETNYQIGENNVEFNTEFSPADRQHLRLNYHYTGVEQSNPGNFKNNYETNRLSIVHTWALDKDDRYDLTSSLDYNDQSGSFNYATLRLQEVLRMHHTDRFETYVDYSAESRNYNTSDSLSNRVVTGFQHRLYDSLTTTGRVGYSTTEGNGVPAVQESFANLSAGYTKKVPGGRLSISLQGGMDQTTNGATSVPQQVIHEPHTFVDPFPIILNHQNIDPTSIKVFKGALLLTEGAANDYTINVLPTRVEIVPTLSGNIHNNDAVEVDYLVLANSGFTSNTTSYGAAVRFDFEEGPLHGLGLYAHYYHQTQTISASPGLTLRPDNVDALILGADYRLWKLFFTAEYEDHQSTLTPYTSTRFTAQYLDRLGPKTSLSINFSYTSLAHPDTGITTDFAELGGRMDYLITRDLRLLLSGLVRDERDSNGGSTFGVEQQAELRWHVRQTDIYLQIRHTTLNTNGSDQDTMLIQAGLVRNF